MFQIIFVLIALLLNRGYYTPLTGPICYDRNSCVHEIGHAVDTVSHTKEYQETVAIYLLVQMKQPAPCDEIGQKALLFPGMALPKNEEKNPLFKSFWTGGWGGYSEFYVSMLEWCNADQACIPETFREFYDWNEINTWLLKKDLVQKD